MTRRSRSQLSGDWHHVFNRGARQLAIFGDDDDRRLFLHHVGEVAATGFAVHAFALMPNHYHLLVEADVAHLSAAMKSLGEAFTRWFNDKYGLDGALFRGRFGSKPILTRRQQLATLRYVHRNPASDGPLHPDTFDWTSHPAYLDHRVAPTWLHRPLLDAIGSIDTYRRWIEGESALTPVFTPRPQVKVMSPETIEWALGVGSGPERNLLLHGGRGVRNDLREACILLGSELTPWGSDGLSARYGFKTANGLRTATTRARRRLDCDEDFASLVDSARRRLAATERTDAKVKRGSDPS